MKTFNMNRKFICPEKLALAKFIANLDNENQRYNN